ncbi:hypothetical protein ABIA71_002583 [Stenotrophomonas sp. 2619]
MAGKGGRGGEVRRTEEETQRKGVAAGCATRRQGRATTRGVAAGSGVGRGVAGVEPQRRFHPLPAQRIGRPQRHYRHPGGAAQAQGHAVGAGVGIGSAFSGRRRFTCRGFRAGGRCLRHRGWGIGRRQGHHGQRCGLGCQRDAGACVAQPARSQQHHAERGPQGSNTDGGTGGGHRVPGRRGRAAAAHMVMLAIRIFKTPLFSRGRRGPTPRCVRA